MNTEKIQQLIVQFRKCIIKYNKKYPKYSFIFNEDLLSVDWGNIKYIIVADNPGEKEKYSNRYLVSEGNVSSSSGSIANKLFEFLEINENVVFLNKCPIYSKETNELKKINTEALESSQYLMAKLTYLLHELLTDNNCKVYIFGLGNCYNSEKGWLAKKQDNNYYSGQIMRYYFDRLRGIYKGKELSNNLFIFKHFSRWSFLSDLCFNDKPIFDGNIVPYNKVKLSELEKKQIIPIELLNALESLKYKNKLFEN